MKTGIIATILCATVTAVCMNQQQQTSSTTGKQYTLIDLDNAIHTQNVSLIPTILTSLENQNLLGDNQYVQAIQTAANLSDSFAQDIEKMNLPWWKELLLGGGLGGFSGYELGTTIYSLYQTNSAPTNSTAPTSSNSGSSLFTGLWSSSAIPLSVLGLITAVKVMYDGWQKRPQTKVNNLQSIQTLLTTKKNNR